MTIRRSILFIFVLLFSIHVANADWIRQKTNSFAWFRDVFFVNETKGWIVGTDGTLLSTLDGGATWVQTHKFTTDSFLQVHFTDDNTGWILCERNIYARGPNASSYLRKTTDGGRNWEKIEFENAGRERVTKLLFNQWGGAVAFGEGGLFYKLQEDGVTWKQSHTAIHFLLLDGAFGDREIGAISGAGGTILFTENSGLTWEKATLMGDTETRVNSIFFVGPKNGWAVGSNGVIYHSSGGGRLWRQQDSGTRVNLNDVYFTTASNGWAVGDNGIIVRTRDGGRTWIDGDSHITHKLEKITFAGSRGWAVGFGGTVLTYDANATNADTDGKPTLLKRN
jgi:photosystem II stability/assembly factor-like uncharacterized protein